jgi:predicted MFS family arabinose efflux permease
MCHHLIVLALGTFAVGTGGFVIAGILPPIPGSLRVGVKTAGQLVAASAIAYAVCFPVLAAATGRWPRRVLLAASLAAPEQRSHALAIVLGG